MKFVTHPESTKGPVEGIVVDHAELPALNSREVDQLSLRPREADNSVRRINERIDAWKASIASGRTLTPPQVGMLRTKYAGKIRTGIDRGKAFEHIRTLENFLDEWFPYGKSLQEMEQILDVSLPVKNGEAVLIIDSGLAGQEYRFLLDRDKIRVVKRTPIN
jgi:hypothetical protein